jgi:hypothetical protein
MKKFASLQYSRILLCVIIQVDLRLVNIRIARRFSVSRFASICVVSICDASIYVVLICVRTECICSNVRGGGKLRSNFPTERE